MGCLLLRLIRDRLNLFFHELLEEEVQVHEYQLA